MRTLQKLYSAVLDYLMNLSGLLKALIAELFFWLNVLFVSSSVPSGDSTGKVIGMSIGGGWFQSALLSKYNDFT